MYFREGFNKFPYKPGEGSSECKNPTPNIGGVDLVSNPKEIQNIPEVKLLPELRETLLELNKPNSHVITLGCAHWISNTDNSHFSYIEFMFKDRKFNKLTTIEHFEKELHKFLIEKLTVSFTQEQVNYYAAYLKSDCQVYYRPLYYLDDVEPYTLLGLTFHFPDLKMVDLHHKALRLFLKQYQV